MYHVVTQSNFSGTGITLYIGIAPFPITSELLIPFRF